VLFATFVVKIQFDYDCGFAAFAVFAVKESLA
jgi:hypothetical protein